MDRRLESTRINADRMQADFNALSEIGETGDGGVHRPTFSDAYHEARHWFREQAKAAGLSFRIDKAGNHIAVLDSGLQNAAAFLLGSHLDSVPNGGRFDGALGVLAALEVLRTIGESGIKLPMNLEAVDFTDEEGTILPHLGSKAICGRLDSGALLAPRGGRQKLEAGLARLGTDVEALLEAERPAGELAGYLELHIEQGPRLRNAGAQIGIVTAIVGIHSLRLSFLGREDHAGTVSMEERRDAGQGASAFAQAAREIVLRDFPGCIVNVGAMQFSPGTFSIVPGRVELSLQFRAPTLDQMRQLESRLRTQASRAAARFGLGLEIDDYKRDPPALMDAAFQNEIENACHPFGLRTIQLVSQAGHDAQSFAGVCPVGMLFVPSEHGASHSPREFTPWSDCVNGANALLQTVLRVLSTNRPT